MAIRIGILSAFKSIAKSIPITQHSNAQLIPWYTTNRQLIQSVSDSGGCISVCVCGVMANVYLWEIYSLVPRVHSYINHYRIISITKPKV